MQYLAIGAIFQNEAAYLAEWIAFHRLQGVEHFYLYDNNSSDHCREVLTPWIKMGQVTLIDWPIAFASGAQKKAYEDCLERSRGKARWVAFIDIDEFLFHPGHRSLPQVLKDYESHPGLVVHWQIFGSRSETADQSASVIERFIHRAPRDWVRNRQVKSIVDPLRTLGAISCHHFRYQDGGVAVNERQQPTKIRRRPIALVKFLRLYAWLLGPLMRWIDPYKRTYHITSESPCDVLRLHHYILKTKSEYALKAERRKHFWTYARSDHFYACFFKYHDRNEICDKILTRDASALRTLLLESRQTFTTNPSRQAE
jgi:hypothetical protein